MPTLEAQEPTDNSSALRSTSNVTSWDSNCRRQMLPTRLEHHRAKRRFNRPFVAQCASRHAPSYSDEKFARCSSITRALQRSSGLELKSQWNADTNSNAALWRAYNLQTLILSVKRFEPFSSDSKS